MFSYIAGALLFPVVAIGWFVGFLAWITLEMLKDLAVVALCVFMMVGVFFYMPVWIAQELRREDLPFVGYFSGMYVSIVVATFWPDLGLVWIALLLACAYMTWREMKRRMLVKVSV